MRTMKGKIVSDKMNLTRSVLVSRIKKHKKYEKYYKTTTKYLAHDPNEEYKEGDTVIIKESRPLSKNKRWIIIGKEETPTNNKVEKKKDKKEENKDKPEEKE